MVIGVQMEEETFGSNANFYGIKSLTYSDVKATSLAGLTIDVILAKYLKDKNHDTWSLIFTIGALMNAASIIDTIRKPVQTGLPINPLPPVVTA